MKHNNNNVIKFIIISIVISTITSAREPININFQNCDAGMNKHFDNWKRSLLSCAQYAVIDLLWEDFAENAEELDARNYYEQFSKLVSSDNIRGIEQFCHEEYEDDDAQLIACLEDLKESFGNNTTKDQILFEALYNHKQIPVENIYDENDPQYYVTFHPVDSYVYDYLTDMASLITSSESMNKFFGDWNNSTLSSVKHAITNLTWTDFSENRPGEVDIRNYFQQLSNVVSSEYIREPKQFCVEKHPDSENIQNLCLERLNVVFEVNDYTTKKDIFNRALLYHKQIPAEITMDEDNPNYGESIHSSESFAYEYLDDIASRITSGPENLYVMYRSPFHYCSWLHNNRILSQLV